MKTETVSIKDVPAILGEFARLRRSKASSTGWPQRR